MSIERYIDHTILKPEATKAMVKQYCDEAKQYRFHSICVNSVNVPFVKEQLGENSGITICSVVGFPLGAMLTEAKAFEAKCAVRAGAGEIDMVINIAALKDGEDDTVREDIRAVVEAAKPAMVKVIIECCLLTEEEKVRACRLSEEGGAAFVKTSTGFSTGGARVSDVRLMKQTVGDRLKVKASGGIHTPEEAKALIAAGADRLGVSAGTKVL